jgi:hypothetical protein
MSATASTTDAHAHSLNADDEMRVRLDLPDAVREVLLPDERVIWTQRGKGARWPLLYWLPSLAAIAATSFIFYMWVTADPAVGASQLVFLSLFGAFGSGLFALIGARIVFGPWRETYVLTDLRFIHCSTFFKPIVRSLVKDSVTGEGELAITYITVWGRQQRGWIMLRPDWYTDRWARNSFGMTGLVGVERPLEIAALIKSTLALDFEIEDHTRP